MRLRPCRRRRPWWPALLAAATSLFTATVLLTMQPAPATAVVTHELGYRATVLGFTSWYGSYGMGSLGRGWCIDHGSHSPDPDFGYVRTSLPDTSPRTRTALAWVAARWGATTDRDTAAAVMLVLHDLMGAEYPYGRLVVDQLPPSRLAGFGGHEAAVVDRARRIKAEALAHASWHGPLVLRASIVGTPTAELRLSVRDADGRGLPGVAVSLRGPATWHLPTTITTGAAGTATRALPAGAAGTVDLGAVVPSLTPDVWRSSSRAAQRIIRPAAIRVTARATLSPPPPTTTSTTSTTTTTAPPPTTTTTTVPSVVIETTTTTSTTAPPITSTTVPASTTTVAPTPSTAPPAPPIVTVAAAPTLPRTGTEPIGLALAGLGLALVGVALVDLAPRAVGQDDRRGSARRRL